MEISVLLLQVQDCKQVRGRIISLAQKHLADFETFWRSRLLASQEEDSHWDWAQKNRVLSPVNYEKYALETEVDKITQGLMIIELDFHRSRLKPNASLVYIDYLATAPWNRPSIKDPPGYKGVGTALFTLALERSFSVEYEGRIGLHALPNAEDFYRKLGMQDFGPDPKKSNLRYFEISEDRARQIRSHYQ